MKKTDLAVKLLVSDIAAKNVLEVACGCAEFSISAASYADSVSCIDLDDSRITGALPENVRFERMDASQMRYCDECFDTVVLYNAFAHIHPQWEAIKRECMRVLKPHGKVYLVSSWKLDVSLLEEVFGQEAERKNEFVVVRVEKSRIL